MKKGGVIPGIHTQIKNQVPPQWEETPEGIIKYHGTTAGATETFNGITYTAVSQATFNAMDPDSADFTNICTSLVTDMTNKFRYSSFNQDISTWDVSNVTTMESLFERAESFNQDIGDWDVSNVTNMFEALHEARAFNQDISGWNVSNVTNMSHMFNNANAFNQDISSWNVSSTTNMANMFQGAFDFNQDISGWDVSNVTDMTAMFWGAKAFNQDLSGWCVTNITSKPYNFDAYADSWTLPRPVWGTCPS